QSRHDLAGARRDGGNTRQQIRGGDPCRRRHPTAAGRHAGLAARPGPEGLYQHAAPPLVPEIIMRWLLLTVCGGLVLAGAVVAATATSPRRLAAAPAGSAMPLSADQAELGKSIRAYLLANPEVLVDAMQELERKQDSQRDAVAQKGVSENQAELYRDPDSPVGGNPNGDVVIVEFNDYQCPYCKRAYQSVKSVASSDGKVKIVYKDIPILGEASKIAAQAA